MISNTGSIPTLHGGNITLQTVKHVTDVTNRRTKIVCTMGPGSWSEEGLATLMDTGMNVARFNFSHGDHEGHGQVLARLRKVAAAKAQSIGTNEMPALRLENPIRTRGSISSFELQRSCWIQRDPKFAQVSSLTASPNWNWSRVKHWFSQRTMRSRATSKNWRAVTPSYPSQ
jgi:Pyruvate kinase, barrel domain